MAVPTAFLFQAISNCLAIFPTVVSSPCAICNMVDSICVPVPFVQTSNILLPTLFASAPSSDNAYLAASIVFFPSRSHASLNGWNICPSTSLIFSKIGGASIGTSSNILLIGVPFTSDPDGVVSVSLFVVYRLISSSGDR